jgi:hypothetical protein
MELEGVGHAVRVAVVVGAAGDALWLAAAGLPVALALALGSAELVEAGGLQ